MMESRKRSLVVSGLAWNSRTMQTVVHKSAGHEIEALRTLGDKDQKTALYSFGTKDLWN